MTAKVERGIPADAPTDDARKSCSSNADGDGDVDLADFLLFAECFTGPDGATSPACTTADLDGDGDVDLADAIIFQASFTGSR